MSATRSYAWSTVADPSAPQPRPRRIQPSSARRSVDGSHGGDDADSAAADPEESSSSIARVDLAGLSVAGITRRRVGWVSAALVAVWIVIVFARQVGDAQAASNQATQLAADNETLSAEVQALRTEVDLVTDPDYVAMEARGYGLGNVREIPFTLDPSVPEPSDGAPGSASVKLGANPNHQSPLESWLQLLFGPSS
jgi:cell division protein FtsB